MNVMTGIAVLLTFIAAIGNFTEMDPAITALCGIAFALVGIALTLDGIAYVIEDHK